MTAIIGRGGYSTPAKRGCSPIGRTYAEHAASDAVDQRLPWAQTHWHLDQIHDSLNLTIVICLKQGPPPACRLLSDKLGPLRSSHAPRVLVEGSVGLAKRRRRAGRRRKSSDLLFLIIAGAIAYAFFAAKLGVIFVVCAWLVVFMIWVMFFMPTYCDYDLGHRGCSKEVYGKLRGCRFHARLKRDAVWAALGQHNPGTMIRLKIGRAHV